MNSFITSVGTGASSSNALPYVFIVTDGSQDYQTQSGGNWGSQNWSATSAVPYQNSATVIPPNTVTSTNYCTTMKNRGITIAILYIPYETIQNANAGFANNEDGYANANIAEYSRSSAGLRLDEFLLHREHAGRHPERAAGDVRAGREHRPHHTIACCCFRPNNFRRS